MNKQRLLNVAKALRESPNPEKFEMNKYTHACGTPACAFGHYASRTDLQDEFCLRDGLPTLKRDATRNYPPAQHYFYPEVLTHFDITRDQARELFRAHEENYDDEGEMVSWGCGDAKTAIEAAEFIEKFVSEAK